MKMRKNLGITQAELAKLTHISRTSILKLEKGQSDLGYSKVKKIFDTLEQIENDRIFKSNLGGITLEEVHAFPVSHVNADDSVHSVWARMIEKDFSQMVVKNEANIVGSITERAINQALWDLGVEKANSLNVEEIMNPPFPMLDVNTPLFTVIPLLQHTQAVITTRKGETIGIVTNSDIGRIFDIYTSRQTEKSRA